MFTHPFPHAFGIDIGDRSVKLVQLSNVGKWNRVTFKPMVMRKCDLAPGLIVNGIIERPEAVRLAIEKLLEGAHKGERSIKSPWVVASVPENHSFLSVVMVPNITGEELMKNDTLSMISKYLPVEDISLYNFDWHIIQNTDIEETDTRVLVGAIPKNIADSYTYLLESLGLGVIALEIEEVAIARSMITAHKAYEEEARAVIDIGSTQSHVIIYDQDIIQFSTALSFSGEQLTDTIAAATNNTAAGEVEALKRKVGIDAGGDNKIYTALMKEVERFTTQLTSTFSSYYRYNKNANKIKRIILCGGSCNLKNLDVVLSQKLEIECVRGNVWKNLGIDPTQAPMENDQALSYSTAIGLALRAADNPFFNRDTI